MRRWAIYLVFVIFFINSFGCGVKSPPFLKQDNSFSENE